MVLIILFLFLFFTLQVLVLFCCAAAGNDPISQAISDQEQLAYLSEWVEKHKTDKKAK